MATVNGTPRKAAIYTRVSSQKQGEEGTSLAGQFAACSAKAKELGADLVAHYEETKSGGLYQSREELQKALADIESGRADTLIIYKLDRGGRDTDALRDIRRRVEKAGAALVFADGMNFEQSATGNLMFNLVGGFAEFEREVIRERTVAGSLRRAQSGKMPSVVKPPFGYHIVRKSDVLKGSYPQGSEGTYVIVEEQAVWVREIFKRAAEGQTLRSITTFLQESGVPTATGVPFWRHTTVKNIVQNPVHKGAPVYRKSQRVVDEKRLEKGLTSVTARIRPEHEQITLSAPPTVSPEQWEHANEQIKNNRYAQSGRSDRRPLLGGLLHCPLCGCRMHFFSTPDKINKDKRIGHYRCNGKLRPNSAAASPCAMSSCSSALLERCVIEAIVYLVAQPELLAHAYELYMANLREERREKHSPKRIKQLQAEIERCQKRAQGAAAMELEERLAGRATDSIKALRLEIEETKAQLEAQLSEMISFEEVPSPPSLYAGPADVPAQIEAVLNDEGVSTLLKNQIILTLFSRVEPVPYPKEWKGRKEPGLRRCDLYSTAGVRIQLRVNGDHVVVLSNTIRDFRYDPTFKRYSPIWEISLDIQS